MIHLIRSYMPLLVWVFLFTAGCAQNYFKTEVVKKKKYAFFEVARGSTATATYAPLSATGTTSLTGDSPGTGFGALRIFGNSFIFYPFTLYHNRGEAPFGAKFEFCRVETCVRPISGG